MAFAFLGMARFASKLLKKDTTLILQPYLKALANKLKVVNLLLIAFRYRLQFYPDHSLR